jgi:hypothetical protein
MMVKKAGPLTIMATTASVIINLMTVKPFECGKPFRVLRPGR